MCALISAYMSRLSHLHWCCKYSLYTNGKVDNSNQVLWARKNFLEPKTKVSAFPWSQAWHRFIYTTSQPQKLKKNVVKEISPVTWETITRQCVQTQTELNEESCYISYFLRSMTRYQSSLQYISQSHQWVAYLGRTEEANGNQLSAKCHGNQRLIRP